MLWILLCGTLGGKDESSGIHSQLYIYFRGKFYRQHRMTVAMADLNRNCLECNMQMTGNKHLKLLSSFHRLQQSQQKTRNAETWPAFRITKIHRKHNVVTYILKCVAHILSKNNSVADGSVNLWETYVLWWMIRIKAKLMPTLQETKRGTENWGPMQGMQQAATGHTCCYCFRIHFMFYSYTALSFILLH